MDPLVQEKDYIFKLIHDEKFEDAMLKLLQAKERWEAASYGYKFKEMREIILSTVNEKYRDSTHWKQRKKWMNLLNKLA